MRAKILGLAALGALLCAGSAVPGRTARPAPRLSSPATHHVSARPARPAAPADVLYDQYDNAGQYATSSQNFESGFASFDDELADDFTVPDGQVWSISTIDAQGQYFDGEGPATSFNVVFYANGANLPGAAVASRASLAYSEAAGDFTITLDPAVTLTAGAYWVSVQANQNYGQTGQWGWQDRTVQSGQGAAWRNPNNGFGTGCINWTRKTTCVTNTPDPDQVFRLSGRSLAWQVVAPMPQARAPVGTSDGTYVYVFGGAGYDTSAFRYDPAANTWTTLADMPTGAFGASAVYYPPTNQIYVFGGLLFGNTTDTTRIYDIASNSWSIGPPMPAPRYEMASGVDSVSGKIFLVGGYSTYCNCDATSTTWVIDPGGGGFTEGAPLPHAAGGFASGVINGHFYVAGGQDAAGQLPRSALGLRPRRRHLDCAGPHARRGARAGERSRPREALEPRRRRHSRRAGRDLFLRAFERQLVEGAGSPASALDVGRRLGSGQARRRGRIRSLGRVHADRDSRRGQRPAAASSAAAALRAHDGDRAFDRPRHGRHREPLRRLHDHLRAPVPGPDLRPQLQHGHRERERQPPVHDRGPERLREPVPAGGRPRRGVRAVLGRPLHRELGLRDLHRDHRDCAAPAVLRRVARAVLPRDRERRLRARLRRGRPGDQSGLRRSLERRRELDRGRPGRRRVDPRPVRLQRHRRGPLERAAGDLHTGGPTASTASASATSATTAAATTSASATTTSTSATTTASATTASTTTASTPTASASAATTTPAASAVQATVHRPARRRPDAVQGEDADRPRPLPRRQGLEGAFHGAKEEPRHPAEAQAGQEAREPRKGQSDTRKGRRAQLIFAP